MLRPPCRKRLEVEMAALAASQQERQHAEALLAAQLAELQAYAAEVEREQQERLLLEQRIRAMESQARRGGPGRQHVCLGARLALSRHGRRKCRLQQPWHWVRAGRAGGGLPALLHKFAFLGPCRC